MVVFKINGFKAVVMEEMSAQLIFEVQMCTPWTTMDSSVVFDLGFSMK